MTQFSVLRNLMLRRLYDLSVDDPSAHPIDRLVGNDTPVGRIEIVADELSASGLVELLRGSTGQIEALKMTANGFYEAERLGGSVRTPAIARVISAAKDLNRVQVVLGILGLIVAAIPIWYFFADRASERYNHCVRGADNAGGYHWNQHLFELIQQHSVCVGAGYTYEDRLKFEREQGIGLDDVMGGT